MEQSVKVGSKQMQAVRQYLALANEGRTPVPNEGMPSNQSNSNIYSSSGGSFAASQYRNNRPTQDLQGRSISYYNGAAHGAAHDAESAAGHGATEHSESHSLWYTPILEPIGGVFSFVGVMIMVIGGVIAAINGVLLAITQLCGKNFPTAFLDNGKPSLSTVRVQFAKSLIVSLEVLVAADVIDTLAKPVEAQTFTQLGLISIIVAVRTVLSLHLGHELHSLKHARNHHGATHAPAADSSETSGLLDAPSRTQSVQSAFASSNPGAGADIEMATHSGSAHSAGAQ